MPDEEYNFKLKSERIMLWAAATMPLDNGTMEQPPTDDPIQR